MSTMRTTPLSIYMLACCGGTRVMFFSLARSGVSLASSEVKRSDVSHLLKYFLSSWHLLKSHGGAALREESSSLSDTPDR